MPSLPLRTPLCSLQNFESEGPLKIGICSTRVAAVGFNLTSANRVFLLEARARIRQQTPLPMTCSISPAYLPQPAFHPDLEAQIIGRVHRLGQRRPVTVTRLYVEGSVEVGRGPAGSRWGGRTEATSPCHICLRCPQEHAMSISELRQQGQQQQRRDQLVSDSLATRSMELTKSELDILLQAPKLV